MATVNWRDILVAVVKKWIPPTIVHFNRKEKAPSERDGLLKNAVLLLQHGLIYRALGEAVAQGDSGRVVKQMQMLTVMFHGGRQSNYATECLEWSAGMLKTWSDDLKRVWLNHCIVNLSGHEGKWIEMDRFNEQLVNYIKAIYNPRGTPTSDHFQREVIAHLIILFGPVKLAMAKAVGATDYSSQHSEVFVFTPGRHSVGSVTDPQPIIPATDLWVGGWIELNSKSGVSDLKDKMFCPKVGKPQNLDRNANNKRPRRQESDTRAPAQNGNIQQGMSSAGGVLDGDLMDFFIGAEVDMDSCF
ncbi:hypothetical protein K440DRAFT_641789 [Wilcoxina mikolae CBS 423.85]|nr:hypothetical protein K440DRAFT_641789 [Wilcoxina mikolae CBS 423.85]